MKKKTNKNFICKKIIKMQDYEKLKVFKKL